MVSKRMKELVVELIESQEEAERLKENSLFMGEPEADQCRRRAERLERKADSLLREYLSNISRSRMDTPTVH